MRENTEWVETVEDGGNILVGAVYEKIMDAIFNFEGEPETGNFFGTGNACVNICEILKSMSVSYSS
jgi:UDP-N-acetylglucosamine 2-epimerase (non-hydrolysing)